VSGDYKTVTAPGGHVEAEAADAAPAAASQTPAAPGVPSITTAAPLPEAKAPELPAGALGDPIPNGASAEGPVRKRTVALLGAAPFVLLFLLWGALACRRAAATDPLKPKREAKARIAKTLEALRSAPSQERTPLLLAWQRDGAVLWDVESAAPASSAIADSAWSGLWAEADRVLYSPDPRLAADWVARAQAALEKKSVRSFSPATLFLPRNIIPVVVFGLALIAPALRAQSASGVYRSGNFPAAEKAWAAQVAADPLDWSARHNLSLALAQQDRWGEAAAEAAAAFVQNPADPATRRQLALAGDKAGFIPEPLDILLLPGPVGTLERLQGPGAWQRTSVACAALLAASLALLLLKGYGLLRGRWPAPAAATLFALAVIGGVMAFVGHRAYGITADARAVVVWRGGLLRSVPTEADVSQKTTTLAAGSTAIADKTFLRWIRLAFPNGQTGWILDTEATYLWQRQPSASSAAPASSAPSAP
jgi:hypothetical protein